MARSAEAAGRGSRPAPRARRRRMPRADREEQMLAAATRIFARRGDQDASMDEIAAACGITKPMLYSYFDSRSEEHTSELQSHSDLVCRLLLEKKKKKLERISMKENVAYNHN